MIKQHLETASLQAGMASAIPSVSFANAELQDFIAACRDAREARKALAVKLVYQNYLYEEIQTILDVSLGSITGWKQAYEQQGINGLRLNHKGRKSQSHLEGVETNVPREYQGFDILH